jgi:hypothetical protein
VLSVVLVSPVAPSTQGIIAVLAVLAFVLGFAFGLGAGTLRFFCSAFSFQIFQLIVLSRFSLRVTGGTGDFY